MTNYKFCLKTHLGQFVLQNQRKALKSIYVKDFLNVLRCDLLLKMHYSITGMRI